MAVPEIPCVALTVGPQSLTITFPGGAQVTLALVSPRIPSPAEAARGLLAEVNAALAPMQPVFLLMKSIGDVLACFTQLPAPPLDDLIDDVAAIAGMLPATSVPIMVGHIIDLLIAYLQGLRAQLEAMIASLVAIAAAATKASTLHNTRLQAVCDCATGKVALQMASAASGGGPINDMIAGVNAIVGLVPGLPTLPTVGALGTDPTAALTIVDAAISALQAIRSAFPV